MTKLNLDKTTINLKEIDKLPLKAFEGNVIIITKAKEVLQAIQEIQKYDIVGFDTETKPVFITGHSNPVSLIQIALPKKVFLFRINKTGLTVDLISLLENPHIIKVGVGLPHDITGLQKIKPHTPQGLVDLFELRKQIGLQVGSVKKLTALLLGFRISKSSQKSNWEASQLSPKQIRYAATDAWVCLELYKKITAHLKSSHQPIL